MVSLSCTTLSRPVLKIPSIRADRGVSLSKRCRISRREAVQAATGGAVDSRDAKSPLSTCSSLYHLGNLRATVHTVSKAALRSAAAGHAASFAFNAAAGSLVEVLRSRLFMRQRDTWHLRTSRRWMLPWCLSEVRRHSWRSGILLSRGPDLLLGGPVFRRGGPDPNMGVPSPLASGHVATPDLSWESNQIRGVVLTGSPAHRWSGAQPF